MANPRTFGKRNASASATPTARANTAAPENPTDQIIWPSEQNAALDEELRAWKRKRSFRMPWRQLSLMASLCFGIASLVLPASVNEAVRGPLYALAAISFWTGIRQRWTK
jgi:hypothetical protein